MINLISITLEWDNEKQKMVVLKREVNPNLKEDIKTLMDKYCGSKEE
jgi:hypothetical protein